MVSKPTCLEFPTNFKFGVATSAYQVEGGWNASGKSQSNWDYYTHKFPEYIKDGTNGDIACDSYNQINTDVANLKLLNVQFYRFSLNWSRLLPHGGDHFINSDGVRYYSELIDKLIKNGIQPMITLYHWDIPQCLQDLGGWTNHIMVDYFKQFASVAFELFGDRVKTWITLNDPFSSSYYGYEEPLLAPFVSSPGVGSYLCGHNLLLAHAEAYHIYHKQFKEKQGGEIGITLDIYWYQPQTPSSETDVEAVNRAFDFHFNWFAKPIFSKTGDYPERMKTIIDSYSKEQGFRQSRLPKFTEIEIHFIWGTADFIVESADPSWEITTRDYFKVNPHGLRLTLKYVKETYNNPKVYIMENGYAGQPDETTNDKERISYMQRYLKAVLEAIHLDDCNVQAYTAWSFMDNYEWSDGYGMRFGLFHVDFNDPKRKRTPKDSVTFYRNFIINRRI